MRTLLFIAIVASAACDGYDEDLGPAPFICGPEGQCPEDYACMDDPATGNKVCISSDDTLSNGFDCADDGAYEPNNGIAEASMTPVDEMKSYVLEDLAICPAGDKDTFAFKMTSSNEKVELFVSYGSNGGKLRASILNAGGIPISNASDVAGMEGTIRAFAQNLPGDTYYAQVYGPNSAPFQNNYKLTLTITTP